MAFDQDLCDKRCTDVEFVNKVANPNDLLIQDYCCRHNNSITSGQYIVYKLNNVSCMTDGRGNVGLVCQFATNVLYGLSE